MGRTPKFSASGPMTRTSGARIPSFIRARSFSACDVYLVNPICCANYTPASPNRQEKTRRDPLLSVELRLCVPPKRLQVVERQEQRILHHIEHPQHKGILSHDVARDGSLREVARREGLGDVQRTVEDRRPRSVYRSRSLCIKRSRITRVGIEVDVDRFADINGVTYGVKKFVDQVNRGGGRGG